MMRSSSTRHKYRPYFSADELQELILSLKESPNPRRLQLIQYLESFRLKIEHGVISAQMTLAPSMIDRLELAASGGTDAMSVASEKLYNQWKLAPATLTPSQISDVLQYRWENSLMTPTEQDQYEQANGLV